MTAPKKIQVDNNTFELNVDSKDVVLIERHFARLTKRDMEIENLKLPPKPLWLNLIIRSIRFYQSSISHRLGNRCVFDPSCSHYAELAFREYGLSEGLKLTIDRLKRCRPENGGTDELTKLTK